MVSSSVQRPIAGPYIHRPLMLLSIPLAPSQDPSPRLGWMDRIWWRWSRQENFCPCFSFCLPHLRVSSSIVLPQLCGQGDFSNPQCLWRQNEGLLACNLPQLVMVSVHGLWIYDYFLTLGDEVRYPRIFRPRFQVLTATQIKYAWSRRKSWGGFVSILSESCLTLTVTRQDSCFSLL